MALFLSRSFCALWFIRPISGNSFYDLERALDGVIGDLVYYISMQPRYQCGFCEPMKAPQDGVFCLLFSAHVRKVVLLSLVPLCLSFVFL